MRRMIWMSVGALWAIVLVAPASAQRDDRLTTKSNRTYSGEVTAVARNEVTVETRAGERKIAVNEIAKISFGDEPRELRLGRDSALRAAYDRALEDLSKVNIDALSRDVVKQDALFYLAWAQARQGLEGGDKAKGARMLQQFLNSYPDSNHYYEAVRTLGDLAVALGRHDVAVKYYRQYGEAPFPEYQLEASLKVAASLRVQGDWQQAMAEYEKVLASSLDSPEVVKQKQFARIGKAACLAGLGKPDEGVALSRQVLRENPAEGNRVLYARAYNALGDCHRALKQPKQALLDYLHTDLLYPDDPDAHAEALYHLAKLWRDAAKNSERALQATTLLRNRYAGTRWAKQLGGS